MSSSQHSSGFKLKGVWYHATNPARSYKGKLELSQDFLSFQYGMICFNLADICGVEKRSNKRCTVTGRNGTVATFTHVTPARVDALRRAVEAARGATGTTTPDAIKAPVPAPVPAPGLSSAGDGSSKLDKVLGALDKPELTTITGTGTKVGEDGAIECTGNVVLGLVLSEGSIDVLNNVVGIAKDVLPYAKEVIGIIKNIYERVESCKLVVKEAEDILWFVREIGTVVCHALPHFKTEASRMFFSILEGQLKGASYLVDKCTSRNTKLSQFCNSKTDRKALAKAWEGLRQTMDYLRFTMLVDILKSNATRDESELKETLREFNKKLEYVHKIVVDKATSEKQLARQHPFEQENRNKIDDKRGKQADGTYHYIGRNWLFDSVRDWANDPNGKQTLLIVGGAGIGKTAFLSELVDNVQRGFSTRIAAVHFCDASNTDTLDTRRFVWGLVLSFVENVPGFEKNIMKSAKVETFTALQEVLKDKSAVAILRDYLLPNLPDARPPGDAGQAKPLLVCLDSLDEALLKDGETIVELVYGFTVNWPKWLRVVATTRPQENVFSCLENTKKLDLTIESNHEGNLADVRKYAKMRIKTDAQVRLTREGNNTLNEYVDAICNKSQGMFLYALLALDEVVKKEDPPSTSIKEFKQTLPEGLGRYYGERFKQLFRNDNNGKYYKSRVLPMLQVIAAARAAVPKKLLLKAAELTSKDGYTRKEVSQVLGDITAFCPALGASNGAGAPYSFVHMSFLDWITDKEQSGDFVVKARDGHKGLTQAALDMTFVASTEKTAVEEENGVCKATARYLAQHGLWHAAEVRHVQEVADKLLLDLKTLLARLEMDPLPPAWEKKRDELGVVVELVERALREDAPRLEKQWGKMVDELKHFILRADIVLKRYAPRYGLRSASSKRGRDGHPKDNKPREEGTDTSYSSPRVKRTKGGIKSVTPSPRS